MEISRLEGLKRQAQKEGWSKYIVTAADENALLNGYTFSFEHFDMFRFYVDSFLLLPDKGQWAGQPFELLNYQEDMCGSLFGWIKAETGNRRFRRAYVEMAKKNGKTNLAAAIGMYMFHGDGEPGAEVYNAANDRDQAGLLWNLAADMVEQSPKIKKDVQVIRSTKRMLIGNNTCFNAWSSDQSAKDGPNIHCVICDELHEWTGEAGRDFWRKIRYGGVARSQPLILAITTAGDDKYSLCFEQHCYAEKIISGVANSDFNFFARIYAADPKRIQSEPDYWKSKEARMAANPAYEIILKEEDFVADIVEAQGDPTGKQAFLRYRLDYWVESSNPWIEIHKWDASQEEPFKEEDLRGHLAFAGMDLSSTNDFTAIAYVLPYKSGEIIKYRAIVRTYIPEEKLRKRIDQIDANLQHWLNEGWIRMTPGDSIDHEFIFNEMKEDCGFFNVKEMGYDRNSAAWIVQQFQKQLPHVELFPISQSYGMSNPTKAVEMAISQRRIQHNNNPVLRWAVSNAVPDSDRYGNVHLHKGKSKDKIDPIIAFIMGFNQAHLGELTAQKKVSFYGEDFEQNMLDFEGVKLK